MKTKKNFLKKLAAVTLGFVMTLGVGAAGYAGAATETRAATVTDTLTADDFSATGTTYTSFTNVKKTSDARYSGKTAKNSSGNIQIRSSGSDCGIVSTVSGGNISGVYITFGTEAQVDIYGKKSAYSSAADLYDTSKQGTKLCSISTTGNATLDLTSGPYQFIGIRSNSGAKYLASIKITWETNGDEPTGSTVTWDSTQQGYSNQQVISTATVDSYTSLAFSKGSGSNDPKYYTSGTAVRLYAKGTLTVQSSKSIIGILFETSSGEDSNAITCSTGTMTALSWSGNAKSVTFTVGGTSGNRRIKKITITYGADLKTFTIDGKSSIYLGKDSSVTYKAMENNTQVTGVKWSVTNNAESTSGTAAIVESTGVLTPGNPGKVIVKATKDGYNEATLTVIIANSTFTEITGKTKVYTDETETYEAKDSDGTVSDVTWSITSGSSYASINSSTGLLTPSSAGNVTIQAAKSGYTSKTLNIQIAEKVSASIEGNGTVYIGESDTGRTFSVKANGSTVTGVTWSVQAGTGSASISSSGVLSNMSVGTITVKATKDGYNIASKDVTIDNLHTFDTITNDLEVSEEGSATYIAKENNVAVSEVTWSITAGNTYATIDSSTGELRGTNSGGGTVTVKVSKRGYTDYSFYVTITSLLKTFVVSGNNSLYPGDEETYVAKENGTPVDGVSWSITSGASYASIDSSTGTLTANAAGNVTVTASKDGYRDADIDITINALQSFTVTGPATVYQGRTKSFTAKDGNNQTVSGVTWSITSGGTLAAIDSSTGALTAGNSGTGSVTVKASKYGYTEASKTITIAADSLIIDSVSVTGTATTKFEISDKFAFGATLTGSYHHADPDNTTIEQNAIENPVFKIDTTSVSVGGDLTGFTAGSHTVHVGDGTKETTYSITIYSAITSIATKEQNPFVYNYDCSNRLLSSFVNILPATANQGITMFVTSATGLSSSDYTVTDGKLTINKNDDNNPVGSLTIGYTSAGKDSSGNVVTGSFTLEVKAADITSIAVSYKTAGKTYKLGDEFLQSDIVVTATYSNGQNRPLVYSEDADETEYTFSPAPNMFAEGTYNVTFTSKENSKTAVLSVKVEKEITVAAHYEKVTSSAGLVSGQYLIVNEDSGKALDGSLPTIDDVDDVVGVTIDKTTTPYSITYTSALATSAFTFDATGVTFKGTNNKYIYHSGSSNSLNTTTTASTAKQTVSFDDSGNAVINGGGNYTLRYNSASNQNRYRYYTSGQQPVQLYKYIPAYTPTIKPIKLNATYTSNKTLYEGDSVALTDFTVSVLKNDGNTLPLTSSTTPSLSDVAISNNTNLIAGPAGTNVAHFELTVGTGTSAKVLECDANIGAVKELTLHSIELIVGDNFKTEYYQLVDSAWDFDNLSVKYSYEDDNGTVIAAKDRTLSWSEFMTAHGDDVTISPATPLDVPASQYGDINLSISYSEGGKSLTPNGVVVTVQYGQVYYIDYLPGDNMSGTQYREAYVLDNEETVPVCSFTPNTGKVFDHWSDGVNDYEVGDALPKAAKDVVIELTAVCEDITYTISYYDYGGGAYTGDNASSLNHTYNYGNSFNLVDGHKTGYDFDGWYDGNGNKVESIISTDIGDKELYAKWSFGAETRADLDKVKADIGMSYTIGQGKEDKDVYQKVTAAPKGTETWAGKYLLAYDSEDSTVVWTGVDAGKCIVEASVTGGQIDAKPSGAVEIEVAAMTGGYSIKVIGGDNDKSYIYGTSGSNKTNFGSTEVANTFEFTDSGIKITSNTSVLRFNTDSGDSNLRFRYYKSTSTSYPLVSLYKMTTIKVDVETSSFKMLFELNGMNAFISDHKEFSGDYGLKVSYSGKTYFFSAKNTAANKGADYGTVYNTDGSVKQQDIKFYKDKQGFDGYFVLNVGDVYNDLTKGDIAFTIQPYICPVNKDVGDGEIYYSSEVSYSIKTLVQRYANDKLTKDSPQIAELKNLFGLN